MFGKVHRYSAVVRPLVFGFALVLAFALVANSSEAQSPPRSAYPTKAIEIVVPFGAGGGGDLGMRIVATRLSKKWSQRISVVTKPGAGGTPGTVSIIQSPSDGYVVGLGGTANLYLNEAVQTNLPYRWSDVSHIAMIALTPVTVVVKGDSKWNSLKELADDIRKDPTKLTYGTSGVAGPSTFLTALLAEAIGVDPNKLSRVPFDGGGPTVVAVAGGHVDFAGANQSDIMELARGGKVKVLAMGTRERTKELPHVPTTREAGFEGVTWAGLFGIIGPPKMRADVIKKWEEALVEEMKDPQYEEQLRKVGLLPQYLNSKDFRSGVESEFKRSLAIAEKLGLRK